VARSIAGSDTLVYVEMAVPILVHSGGEAARLFAQCRAAQHREMDLTAMGMAAQHQIATPVRQTFNGARIVSEHHARNGRTQTGEGDVQVTDATPQILHADQIKPLALALDWDR